MFYDFSSRTRELTVYNEDFLYAIINIGRGAQGLICALFCVFLGYLWKFLVLDTGSRLIPGDIREGSPFYLNDFEV